MVIIRSTWLNRDVCGGSPRDQSITAFHFNKTPLDPDIERERETTALIPEHQVLRLRGCLERVFGRLQPVTAAGWCSLHMLPRVTKVTVGELQRRGVAGEGQNERVAFGSPSPHYWPHRRVSCALWPLLYECYARSVIKAICNRPLVAFALSTFTRQVR